MRAVKLITILFVSVTLVACGAAAPDATPTRPPAATNTPISTALPSIATMVPAGFPGNPLQMVIIPDDPVVAARQEVLLEEAILAASNVTVDVVFARTNAEAFAVLCSAGTDAVSIAWVDGLTYAAASARDCGEAVLQLVDEGTAGRSGEVIAIVLNRALGTADLSVLRGRTFCRISYADPDSWLLPLLMLQAVDIAVDDFDVVNNYANNSALLDAVASGECSGAAFPQSQLDLWLDDGDARIEDVRVAQTSVVFPYPILMYSFDTPLAARLSLTEGLLGLDAIISSTAEATPELSVTGTAESTPEPADMLNLRAFFGPREIVRVDQTLLNTLVDFLRTTNVDLSNLAE